MAMHRVWLSVVVGVGCVSVLLAQDAQSVIAAYRRAVGDVSKLEQLRSWSVYGKMTSADGSWKRSYRAWFEGKRARTELTLQPGIVAVTWSDGARGWSIQPWSQSLDPQPLNASGLKRLQIFASMLTNDLVQSHPSASIEYLGTEEVDGSDCYKLRARHADGSVWTYYLDPDVGLLVKLEVEADVSGEPLQWEASFSNYRSVEGVMLPMLVDFSGNLLVVDRYELNPTLDAKLFAPPVQ